MAYIENDTIYIDGVKFVLTDYGKQQGFKHGLLNIIKYFTVSDDGIIYTSDTSPNQLKDVNGSHLTSTNIPSGSINIINK